MLVCVEVKEHEGKGEKQAVPQKGQQGARTGVSLKHRAEGQAGHQ